MRAALVAFLAMVGSASGAHAQDAVVQTFVSVCIEGRASFAVSEAAALRSGWVTVEEAHRPELQTLFGFVRSNLPVNTPVSQLQAYGSDQSNAVIVLTELTVQGHLVNGCYVYDFDATVPLAPEVFVQIMGEQPTESQSIPGEIVMQKWIGPAALEGVATLRVAFIVPGSESGRQTGLVGLALASTSFTRAGPE
jgi:hypothetical protein